MWLWSFLALLAGCAAYGAYRRYFAPLTADTVAIVASMRNEPGRWEMVWRSGVPDTARCGWVEVNWKGWVNGLWGPKRDREVLRDAFSALFSDKVAEELRAKETVTVAGGAP